MTQALQERFIRQHPSTGKKAYDLLGQLCIAAELTNGEVTDATIATLQGCTNEEWVKYFKLYQVWRDGLQIELSAQVLGDIHQALDTGNI